MRPAVSDSVPGEGSATRVLEMDGDGMPGRLSGGTGLRSRDWRRSGIRHRFRGKPRNPRQCFPVFSLQNTGGADTISALIP